MKLISLGRYSPWHIHSVGKLNARAPEVHSLFLFLEGGRKGSSGLFTPQRLGFPRETMQKTNIPCLYEDNCEKLISRLLSDQSPYSQAQQLSLSHRPLSHRKPFII